MSDTPTDANDFTTTYRTALEAMARMEADGIPPIPKNFSVWYAYYANLNPELNRAIDILARNKESASPEQYYQLYDNYLHEVIEHEQAVQNINNRLQNTLAQVQQLVVEASKSSHQFNSRLDNANGELVEFVSKTPLSVQDIQRIIQQLVDDSKALMLQNESMHLRLADNSRELNEMRQDLFSVREEAMTDALTGISNRKAFDARLLQAAVEASQDEEPLALLLIDIDHFKKFNDTYGHQAGDQVLRLVAQTFKRSIKGKDTAARFGGEEFAIILPGTTADNAARVADVLRLAVASKEVVNRSNNIKLGQITISVGVSEYRTNESLEDLIERADSALYRAKQAGRNQVVKEQT